MMLSAVGSVDIDTEDVASKPTYGVPIICFAIESSLADLLLGLTRLGSARLGLKGLWVSAFRIKCLLVPVSLLRTDPSRYVLGSAPRGKRIGPLGVSRTSARWVEVRGALCGVPSTFRRYKVLVYWRLSIWSW